MCSPARQSAGETISAILIPLVGRVDRCITVQAHPESRRIPAFECQIWKQLSFERLYREAQYIPIPMATISTTTRTTNQVGAPSRYLQHHARHC